MNKRTLVPHPTNPEYVGVNQFVLWDHFKATIGNHREVCHQCPDRDPCNSGIPTCHKDRNATYVWVPKHIGVAAVLEAEDT